MINEIHNHDLQHGRDAEAVVDGRPCPLRARMRYAPAGSLREVEHAGHHNLHAGMNDTFLSHQ